MVLAVVVGVIAVLFLAFANGANDISKTIATLVGSKLTTWKKALLFGAAFNTLGALFGYLLGKKLANLFAKIVIDGSTVSDLFAVSAIIGAVIWVIFATRLNMPVSTTHSITGAIVFLTVFALGWERLSQGIVVKKIILPLLIAPLVSFLLAYLFFWLYNGRHTETGIFGVDKLHWVSAGLSSFARGVQDGPKIVALAVICFLAKEVNVNYEFSPLYWMYIGVALTMGLGCLLWGLRVTKTLAYKITHIDHADGFVANAVTGVLVILGGWFGWPMSTTHVSSGAIIGIGTKKNVRKVKWKTVWEMILAWIVTLPASGAFAIVVYYGLNGLF